MTKALRVKLLAVAAALVAAAACAVHQTEPTPVSGPSTNALLLVVTATPDTILQDGGSQSSIRITAQGPNGQNLSGVPIRVDMAVGGVPQDFGTLSARNVITGSDGTATVVFTSPPAPVGGVTGTCNGLPGQCVEIVATPTGTNFGTTQPQFTRIRLVPTGVILPPAATPTASFTFSPSTPTAGSPVAFDASASCPEGATTGGCVATSHTITSVSWNFGDGSTGSGTTTSHTFASSGVFNVTLTVTNDRGLSASKTQQVTVGTGTPPTVAFVFGPTPVVVGATTNFDASASKAASGRTIASFTWSFGDGDRKTTTTPTTTHDFGKAGTFTVSLTVTDDIGQTGVATQSVTVTNGGGGGGTAPTSKFTFSPSSPGVNQDVFFNASSSTPGSAAHSITAYNWDFGDGSTATGQTTSHAYGRSGTFTVTLVVTDDTGQQGTSSATVTVSGASSQIVADFTFSPTDPSTGQTVNFDATPSSSPSTITTYVWDFGDGSRCGTAGTGFAACPGSDKKPTHAFATANTFVVRLTITDSASRSATTTKNVVVK